MTCRQVLFRAALWRLATVAAIAVAGTTGSPSSHASAVPRAKAARVATRVARSHTIPDGVLQCHTMAEGLDWLPEDGVVLTRDDLERIFMNLRALIAGTGKVDPNRSFAVDIAIAITHAIERESGDE